jgi:hypothetical protein
LVYGDPNSAETYDGARDYDSLSEFAKEHVSKHICSIYRLENCSDDKKKLIEDLENKTDVELEAIATKVEDEVKDHEKLFDVKVVDIQTKYDAMVEEFNKELEVIKIKYNYKFVEQIMTIRGVGDEGNDYEPEEEYESEL